MTDRGPNGRRFGVLLPVSSLPGPEGIGTLGAPARRWLEWLHAAGASVWQLLPLGPLGKGHSPYSAVSSFAGSPLLISPESLAGESWARSGRARELSSRPSSHPWNPPEEERPSHSLPGRSGRAGSEEIDYPRVGAVREAELRALWQRLDEAPGERREALAAFLDAPEQRSWLSDWTLFAALSESDLTGHGHAWTHWPEPLKWRDPDALERARTSLAAEIAFHGFVQFLFHEQTTELRRWSEKLGIETLGDLPFYPALQSADVWSRPEIFDLGSDGRPRHVAGVPPDAYTDEGQLWGHPVLRWAQRPRACRQWWVERSRAALRQTDRVRLDHFRGYSAYWSVPAGAETAAEGEWVDGPGLALFEEARVALGGLPFVAEDLGYITDDVRGLLSDTGLAGMRVLQFAFGEHGAADHLPGNVPGHCVYCTSTHDNDTARGWFESLDDETARQVLDTLDARPETIHLDMLRAALESPAELVLAPVQDLLDLGSEARLNTPGVSEGQWTWRLRELPGTEITRTVRDLVEASGRSTASGEA